MATFLPVAFGSSATRSISAPPPRIASAGNRKPNAAANGDVSCRRPSAANALAGQGRSKKRADSLSRPPPSGPIKASTRRSDKGGFLTEKEAAIYRAEMAEQRSSEKLKPRSDAFANHSYY
uniref:Uncharacterized protein n=1 Tax=Mesocestoides corti TaxID=53468 RepID=A0A5K3G1D6_MESCO